MIEARFRPISLWPYPDTVKRRSRWTFSASWSDTLGLLHPRAPEARRQQHRGKFEVTVAVQNRGATHEALEEVWLLYSHPLKRGEVSADSFPSVRKRLTREVGDLPPRRNVRSTVDISPDGLGGCS